MKKSTLYRLAQISVLSDTNLNANHILEVLRELMKAEDSALFWEEKEEQEEQKKVAQAV